MNQNIRYCIRLSLILLFALAVTAGTCLAATYNLRTGTVTKTMPDGLVVTMWGFGLDSYDLGAGGGLVLVNGPIQVPGPELTVPPGDTALIVNLTNNLTVPVSIVIPGQTPAAAGVATAMTPVWVEWQAAPPSWVVKTMAVPGTRNAGDVTSRVRSLDKETAPGGTVTYEWIVQPGTYLYKSGTHMQIQVPLGLYGAMKKNVLDAAPPARAQAYVYPPPSTNPPVEFDVEQVLLYSEVDPTLLGAVRDNKYGVDCAAAPCTMTSAIDYHPQYYLINGEPFSAGRSPIPIGAFAPTPQTTLLRLLNAGNEDYVPTLLGPYLTVVAENGKAYPFAKQQYQVFLSGGKTVDALLTPVAEGYLPLLDRRGHLNNAAGTPGGLLAYLTVPNAAPVTLTVNVAGTGTGKVQVTSLPGGIDTSVPDPVNPLVMNVSEAYNPNTVVALTATANNGSAFRGWSGGLAGNQNPAYITLAAVTTITATFDLTPPLTVMTPNGGQLWRRGSIQSIIWNYAGNLGPNVKLELYRDNGAGGLGALQTTIKASVSIGTNGVGFFSWRVPTAIPTAPTYRVVVRSISNPTVFDASDGVVRFR
ncbi:MAG: hypothetical protein EHM23_06890 [Acidobacteria bacterium]|nr:MAG: hypothetical protein EHM23_06890 [Acidobacteriota bacterium]